MNAQAAPAATDVDRARATLGINSQANYLAVARLVRELGPRNGTLLDVGCGKGLLWEFVKESFTTYVGVDVIHYPEFPDWAGFHRVNLNTDRILLPDASGDVIVSVGTIEYLENPRAFFRELTRLLVPGGHVIVSCPNQLSWLNKLSFVIRNRHNAFPHEGPFAQAINPVLEGDLVRIARDCGLSDIRLRYNDNGRIPLTRRHWPKWPGFRGRGFSDTVLLAARRADA